jgi:hypothetical protein
MLGWDSATAASGNLGAGRTGRTGFDFGRSRPLPPVGARARRAVETIRSQLADALQAGTRAAKKGVAEEGDGDGAASLTTGLSGPFLAQASPPLGLRGGLGKSLLIAFLLLAIVPLGLLAFFTYDQIQRDTRQRLAFSLEEMVALKGAYLVDWVEGRQRELVLIAEALEQRGAGVGGLGNQEEARAPAISCRLLGSHGGHRPGLFGLDPC